MASLSLKSLSLTYPNGVRALDGVDLEIEDGEFLAVLGPSGCGKSSLLRLVAGLETPTSGAIHMDARDITALEPKDRDVAMVFQGLALYPHMTVRDNMAFGLLARKTPTVEIEKRVSGAAATLGLAQHLHKRPRELSGGERQRVALGRALVRSPKIFLFDEPLSSLDAQLRQELREELARLHRLTKTTSIYVTHDQKEALSLGDRIAVFDRGHIRQVGTPEAIYRDPRDLFVARFVGDPAINLIEGEFAPATSDGAAGGTAFRSAAFSFPIATTRARSGPAVLGLRPEAAVLGGPSDGSARATVERVERLGGDTWIHVKTEAGTHVLRADPNGPSPAPGEVVGVTPDPARALFFGTDGTRIRLDL
jgi:ABC-type sugar transport system ATPase subunit